MEKLKDLAHWFWYNHGIDLYIVGGAIRDEIMNLPVNDVDICIVGGHTAKRVGEILEILYQTQNVDEVTPVHGGFPIWIVNINKVDYEFAMARTERKIGETHQEFETKVQDVSIEQDLERRDITINAMAKHIMSGKIIDPFGGRKDIAMRRAHPVSQAFTEDPLRVYRVARFCSKFWLQPSYEMIKMCQGMNGSTISNERVGKELRKVFEQSGEPSTFFYFLKEVGWLKYHFQELLDCVGVPQNPVHHPEKYVFEHTMHCIDVAKDPFTRAVMLCHDLGKVSTTQIDGLPWKDAVRELKEVREGSLAHKITAHDHEEASVPLTRQLLQRISFDSHANIRKIACLVELHMIRATIMNRNKEKMVRRTLRKLMKYGLTYLDLVYVVYCDVNGRPPKMVSLSQIYEDLHVGYAFDLIADKAMEPIVTGEMLLAMGIPEGKDLGNIVNKALELQDRGTLTKDNWKKRLHQSGFNKLIKVD